MSIQTTENEQLLPCYQLLQGTSSYRQVELKYTKHSKQSPRSLVNKVELFFKGNGTNTQQKSFKIYGHYWIMNILFTGSDN